MTDQPLGKYLLGGSRLGDGQSSGNTHTLALPLSFVISPSRHALALPLTFQMERRVGTALSLFFTISAGSEFAINGDATIINPDRLSYSEPPSVATTAIGGLIQQGYRTMVWTYSLIEWNYYAHLLSFYHPQNPRVTVTWLDRDGLWKQQPAIMRPPQYGSQQTLLLSNVSFSFLLPLS